MTVVCAAQLAILLCLVDIAAGMSYLHSIGLLHSDLKGGNVLLKSSAPTTGDPRGFVCKVQSAALSVRNLVERLLNTGASAGSRLSCCSLRQSCYNAVQNMLHLRSCFKATRSAETHPSTR